MARRFKKRKYSKRRRVIRRKRSSRRKVMRKRRSGGSLGKMQKFIKSVYVQRGPCPFPNRVFLRLPYKWSGRLVGDSNAATYSTGTVFYGTDAGSENRASMQSFRLNSVYDPDYTGFGLQPRWFDQWTLIYNNYRIHKAAVSVQMQQGRSTLAAGVYGTVNVATDTTAGTTYGTLHGNTFNEVREWNNTASKHINSHNQGPVATRISSVIDCAKAFGIPKAKYLGDTGFDAQYNANPTRTLYMEVGVVCSPPQTPQLEVYVEVSIIYWIEMWGFKMQGPS